jgi:hypothetical protein
MLRKIYGRTQVFEVDAWESLGVRIIRQIMEETCYNVDDVNYDFCNSVCGRYQELHHVAGGLNVMACFAWERARIATDSLDRVMNRLSSIFVEYEDVLPFS